MRPTIERLSIYVRMLEVLVHGERELTGQFKVTYLTYKETKYAPQLCLLLEDITASYENIENYPEIYECRPSGCEDDDPWWPNTLEGLEIRINVLKIAIELCQEKIAIGA